MSPFQRLLVAQLKRINGDAAYWAFPALLGFGWILWPALDYEWKMELGLAPDPEAAMNRVYEAKLARMEAAKITHGTTTTTTTAGGKVTADAGDDGEEEDTEEESEEEEEAAGDEPEEKDDEETAADDDVPAMEDGDAEEGDDDEEEEPESIKFKPLYVPTKAAKLNMEEVWDNFTIKALNMSEDDDDDEEGTYDVVDWANRTHERLRFARFKSMCFF